MSTLRRYGRGAWAFLRSVGGDAAGWIREDVRGLGRGVAGLFEETLSWVGWILAGAVFGGPAMWLLMSYGLPPLWAFILVAVVWWFVVASSEETAEENY